MEAGGVCLQKWRRQRRRKRSETPAETVSKGWGGPSPPPGHGERPPGRDGMCCGAGGGAGGVNHGAGSRPTGREEPSRAEPSPASRCGCPAPREGIALFLQLACTAVLGATLGARWGPAVRGAATGGVWARQGALRAQALPAASLGWDPPSPGPPNFQSARQRLSISFAKKKKKSGENGKKRARRQASSCPAQRESPLRRQHLHGPSGPGAAPSSRPCPGEDEALLTARYRPLGAPRRSPGPSFASARGKATRPPRRVRPGPGTSASLGPRPGAGPSGRVATPKSRGNAPTGRAEPWGAPVATVAMGVA